MELLTINSIFIIIIIKLALQHAHIKLRIMTYACTIKYILYVCSCMLQCGRTAMPNTGVENYKSINQAIREIKVIKKQNSNTRNKC